MKLTAFIENTTDCPKVQAEHGLSLWIEANGKKILFDMGQTDAFAENAAALGYDLATADLAVLSHGHYDHGGGLRRFLERNASAKVYLSRYAFEEHFSLNEKPIGLDPTLQQEQQLVFTDEEYALGDGLTLYACNMRERTYRTDPFGLTMLRDGVIVEEDFRHEQYLLVEENGRRILISGCSHKGILNLMDWFRPDVLVGGFHLMKLETNSAGCAVLEETARLLNQYPTEYYTCHCTGNDQYAYLKTRMPRLHYLSAGQTIHI